MGKVPPVFRLRVFRGGTSFLRKQNWPVWGQPEVPVDSRRITGLEFGTFDSRLIRPNYYPNRQSRENKTFAPRLSGCSKGLGYMRRSDPLRPVNICAHNRKSCVLGRAIVDAAEREPAHLVFIPESYEPGYAYPLLIWLHSAGGDEEQLLRLMPFVSLRNYVALAPRGMLVRLADGSTGYGWPQNPQGLDYAQRVIASTVESVALQYHISRQRVFVAGWADGGSMAVRLALSDPHRFAGAVAINGAIPTWGRPLVWLRQQRQLSLLVLYGARSHTFPPREACRALRLLHAAGLNVVLRQYPCGDELHQAMLADLNRWLMGEITGQRPFVTQGEAPTKLRHNLSACKRSQDGAIPGEDASYS